MVKNVLAPVLFFVSAVWANIKMMIKTLWQGLKPQLQGINAIQAIVLTIVSMVIILKPELAVTVFAAGMVIYSTLLLKELKSGKPSWAELLILPASFLVFALKLNTPLMLFISIYGVVYQTTLSNYFEKRVSFSFKPLFDKTAQPTAKP